jgi:purine-nucleoside phosphorylase
MKAGFEARVAKAVASARHGLRGAASPEVALVLGSGLGDLVDGIEGTTIPYTAIEGFPAPTVAGHRGLLRLGTVGRPQGPLAVAVLAGRFHYYEGHPIDDVVLPVFTAHGLGARTLIVTNASGAVNTSYSPGDLVLIRDHINLMGANPLIGPHAEGLGPRFPDMSEAYSRRLRETAQAASGGLAEGVYAALSGPAYETPAEIRMLRAIGADLVGMSTVPEVIAARFLGLEVLGISCVTNMAAGILERPLSHAEVVETGKRVAARFAEVVFGVLGRLAIAP